MRTRYLVGAVASALMLAASLAAQQPPDIDQILELLKSGASSSARMAIRKGLEKGRFSAREIQSLAAGLDELADSDDAWVSGDAAANLAMIARRESSVVGRVLRVFRESDDAGIRALILLRAHKFADRPATIAFLASIASAREAFHSEAVLAVQALVDVGAEGRARLAQLDRDGLVQNEDARRMIARLKEQGIIPGGR